jgi:hypothetical protein
VGIPVYRLNLDERGLATHVTCQQCSNVLYGTMPWLLIEMLKHLEAHHGVGFDYWREGDE